MEIHSFIYNISTTEWIIIALYTIFFFIQLFYYLNLFRKPYLYVANNVNNDTINKSDKELPGISIIITAKNEADNLRKNLPKVLNQEYPHFQVVVVNNSSTDNTSNVLDELKSKYPHLYTTFIPVGSNDRNDKKLAITVGIKAAKHNILLFTEPDTKPLSNKWVYEYAKAFNNNAEIVLGGCQLEINKSFFKKYILFDNLFSGIKYTSMALTKKPYMGIGRNMAFKKKLFFDYKGFSSILNIEDGEDNLFINKITKEHNTAVLLAPASMVVSNAINGFINWRNIKTNYVVSRKHYTGNKAKRLTFEVFSRYLFYILFALLVGLGIRNASIAVPAFALSLFLIRYVVQLIVINKNSNIYNAGNFYFSIPLFDLATPITNQLLVRREKKRNDILSER